MLNCDKPCNTEFQRARFFRLLPLAAAVSVAMAGEAEAQESVEMAPVEVWGASVNSSSLAVDDADLSVRQADHVSDLLRTIPGVDVGGAHSLNQRITVRSLGDRDIDITIDGASQNSYMYHHMGNLQIHADILESVDIEVGNNSVVSGGLGGAIRFRTKRVEDLLRPGRQAGGRVRLGYGDNSDTSYSLTGYSLLGQQFDVLGYINLVDRQDYRVGGGKILDYAGNEIAGTDGEVRGLEGDLRDSLIKFGWVPDDRQRVTLGLESYLDEGDYSYRPDMGLATDLAISESLGVPLTWPTEFSRDTLTLNHEIDLNATSSIETTLFRNTSTLERDESAWSQNESFASWAGDAKGEAVNQGIDILSRAGWSGHELTYGGKWADYQTDYTFDYDNGESESSEESMRSLAVFLQDRIALGPQFSLIPGLRYESNKLDATVSDDTFSAVTAALAGEFQATDNLSLRISATQLYKAPEIGEVFTGAGLYEVTNDDIEAEGGLNSELGLEFDKSLSNDFSVRSGITVFNTRIADYIYEYAPAPESTGANSWQDNVGDMTLTGLEAYLGFSRGGVTALLSLSKADSDLDAETGYETLEGARIDRKQGDTLALEVDYRPSAKNWLLHWDILNVDGLDADLDLDGASTDNAKQGFTVHNISAQWYPAAVEGLSLTLGVDNVFDEFYASQSSRTGLSTHPRFGELYLLDYEPGRNIKASVAYEF